MLDIIQWIRDLPEIWKSVLTILLFASLFLIYSFVSKRRKQIKKRKSSGDNEAINNKRILPNAIEENVRLIDVNEEVAAVIMAVVAENLGEPIENLRFKSIRHIAEPVLLEGVSDELAAVIMAITSYNTKLPLQRLDFSSIKLITD